MRKRVPIGSFKPISRTAVSLRMKCVESAMEPVKLRPCVSFILKKLSAD